MSNYIHINTLLNLTGTFSLPFTDGGIASTFIVRGNGKLKFNRNITGGDSFLVTTNANTVVDWEFDEIDIRRRWGANGHNCARWRMVGRRYLNREAMIFAFRYPAIGTSAREVFFKVEETTVLNENANDQWTRAELRNFNGGSKATLDFGNVVYPNAFPTGAFVQITGSSSDSEINTTSKSAYRGNNRLSNEDYFFLGIGHFAKESTLIENIDTPTGIAIYSGAGGSSSVKKCAKYKGRIRPGYIGASFPYSLAVIQQDSNIELEVNVLVDSLSANLNGFDLSNSPLATLKGKIIWRNTTNAPIRANSATGTTGRLENLVLSEIPLAVPSVLNANAAPLILKVVSCYATTAVSTANGGVVQLIDTITVNTNV